MSRTRTSSTPWSATAPIYVRSMTDTEVPDFKARVAAGELLCNPMQSVKYQATGVTPWTLSYDRYTRYKISAGVYSPWKFAQTHTMVCYPGSIKRFYSPAGFGTNALGVVQSWINSRHGFLSSDVASVDTLAEMHTELSAKLAAGMTQSLVTLAEMPRTIKMIYDALRILRHPYQFAKEKLRLTRSAIRNEPGKREELLNVAQDAWMQGRFGWRSMIYDIVGHLEALEKDFSIRQTVRAGLPIKESSASAGPYLRTASYFGSGRPYLIENWEGDASIMYRMGQTGDMLIDFGNFQHFGALDPLGTAWELVTLSWAVDYFLNIGDILQSLQAYLLLDERVGWTTYQVKAQAKCVMTLGSGEYTWEYEKGVNVTLVPGLALENAVSKIRTPVVSFMPNLDARIDLKWMKVLDLAAVVRNLYGRRKTADPLSPP